MDLEQLEKTHFENIAKIQSEHDSKLEEIEKVTQIRLMETLQKETQVIKNGKTYINIDKL